MKLKKIQLFYNNRSPLGMGQEEYTAFLELQATVNILIDAVNELKKRKKLSSK